MRQAAGQVARSAHRWTHYLLGLLTVLLLAAAVLGWRLAQGPIPVPLLARAIEAEANTPEAETLLDIGSAALAWDGLDGEGMTPLEIRLGGVRLLGRDGAPRGMLPDAAVSLSIPWLLRGELAPHRLELRNPLLLLRRGEDGRVSLQLGAPEGGAAQPVVPTPAGPAPLDELLAIMMRPPTHETPFGALRHLAISGAQVVVQDAALSAVWSLEGVAVELSRRPQGGVGGRGRALLRLGDARIPIEIAAEASGAPMRIAFRATLPQLEPGRIAEAVPAMAPLAALEAPLAAELAGVVGAEGELSAATVTLRAGPGRARLPGGETLDFAEARLAADLGREEVRITAASLRLAGADAPTLAATGRLERRPPGWVVEAELALDSAPAARLAEWWPESLAPGGRAWVTQNITAGIAHDGRWSLAAEAAHDGSAARLTALSGTLEVADATVHWLRPVPPAEGARGRLSFGLDAIEVALAEARQGGTQVVARDGTVRILFPAEGPERAEIALPLAGPVPDVLAVLRHPRLNLLDRRPLPFQEARGSLEGTLTVALPLLDDLPVERLQIAAQARLRDLRLANIALDRPLERGAFELAVNTEGLRANGTGTLAGIAGRIGLELDFRAGPASQVLVRATMQGRTEASHLASLGLSEPEVAQGPVGLDLRYEQRRNGQGRVTARADLRQAVLTLDPLAWRKPAGQNAGGEAVLRLSGDQLEAIEAFRVEAPSLLLRGSATFARGARFERVVITEGRIEQSRFTGEARPPGQTGGHWEVSLRGPVLDLRAKLAEESPAGPAPPDQPGPALVMDARFERVLLGDRRELSAVVAAVLMDGRGVLRQGQLSGRAGPRGGFEAAITPVPQGVGRTLRLTAEDAGALLAAFDVLQRLEGGRLVVNATYAHNAPGAPLSGTAEMTDFRMRNAPAVAKLLQAMTLYGLVEALSGEGLGFARLVAPFTLTPDLLTLGEARAFSASLGLTATGTLDRRRQRLAMEGTIVPAYIFNSLLGNIPVLGRIFSPEAGGGVFAATWRAQGPLDDPQVSVNPLAALTPGFLRGLFGIGQQARE